MTHTFIVVIDDDKITPWTIPPRKGRELAAARLFHDLAEHMGPEAEPLRHIEGVYYADPVFFSDGHIRQGRKVRDE